MHAYTGQFYYRQVHIRQHSGRLYTVEVPEQFPEDQRRTVVRTFNKGCASTSTVSMLGATRLANLMNCSGMALILLLLAQLKITLCLVPSLRMGTSLDYLTVVAVL